MYQDKRHWVWRNRLFWGRKSGYLLNLPAIFWECNHFNLFKIIAFSPFIFSFSDSFKKLFWILLPAQYLMGCSIAQNHFYENLFFKTTVSWHLFTVPLINLLLYTSALIHFPILLQSHYNGCLLCLPLTFG